jgi:hypothetical protein
MLSESLSTSPNKTIKGNTDNVLCLLKAEFGKDLILKQNPNLRQQQCSI